MPVERFEEMADAGQAGAIGQDDSVIGRCPFRVPLLAAGAAALAIAADEMVNGFMSEQRAHFFRVAVLAFHGSEDEGVESAAAAALESFRGAHEDPER